MVPFANLGKFIGDHLRQTRTRFQNAGKALDVEGWVDHVTAMIYNANPELVRQAGMTMLRQAVRKRALGMLHGTRPAAAQIAKEIVAGQMLLPTFDEASVEMYEDGTGAHWLLVDMSLQLVLQAAEAYLRRGRENTLKGQRLLGVAAEMRLRGLADYSLVRELYDVAV